MGIACKMAMAKENSVDRPWNEFEVSSHPNSPALFAIVVKTKLGNVNNTFFWTYNWLHRCSVENLAPMVAPMVFACVPPIIHIR
jgi:hypothetical protein